MKYCAIFTIPDDQVVFEGRPAIMFSQPKDSEVLLITIADEIIPEESLDHSDNETAQEGLASAT